MERIQLAVMASHDNNGINTTSLAKNLSEINGLTDIDNNIIIESTEITLPKIIKLNNFSYKIKVDGEVENIPNKLWLFNKRQNIEGNWDAKPYRSPWGVAHNDGSQILNYEIENSIFKITGQMHKCGIVYLTDIIDFSVWKNVYINVTSTDSVDVNVALVKKNSLKDNFEAYWPIETMTEDKLYSADISNINEECYIGIYGGGIIHFNFDELYLTR